ncbi:zinc finger MYM-type protein 1-like [Ambystoma mexicanum]|uniref:zinc finger MYM-type protein 1-like n=1 Tax=Ambystoma mexicanum TaxID=8296 RepID=UPI0037E9BEC4
MPPKKLSGAQNRKGRAQFESDLQKSAKLMKTFLGQSEDSTVNTVQIVSSAQPGNDAESSDLPCNLSQNNEYNTVQIVRGTQPENYAESSDLPCSLSQNNEDNTVQILSGEQPGNDAESSDLPCSLSQNNEDNANNLAFRGSSDKLFTDHNGNFLGMVELLGKYDDVMRKHLKQVVRKEVKDHYCSNRWKILTNNVRNLTVKPLSDTRWECCIDSVKAVRFQVTDIYDALMELAQLSKADAGVRHEAQTLANQITDLKFLVSLVVWHHILFQINIVSKTLQNKSVDIVTATSLMKGCIQFFVAYRDNGFENAIISAKEMAADLGVEPAFKEIRIRQRKRQFDYEGRDDLTQTQSPEEKFKREYFYVLVDTAHGSIEERFGQMKDHEQCWGFLYDLSKLPMDKKKLLEHCTNLHQTLKHGESSDINGKDLYVELENIRYMLPRGTGTPLPVLQYIHDANLKNIFPNVWISLKILLTLPVTVASGERSFSKLKLIKTYLRSTMANERLTLLAILSIENDIGQSLDLSDAVLQFARAKSRKVTF